LSYSWCSSESGGDLHTVLTFLLTETSSGGTHLRLIHSGFPAATAQIIHLPRQELSTNKTTGSNSSGEVKMLWAA
jgi:hypothetical protein